MTSKFHNPESVVLLDVDGVLANFLDQLIKMLGAEDRISPKEITKFQIFQNECITKDDARAIKQIWQGEEFWLNMPAFPLARTGVAYLRHRGWNPVFASACMPTFRSWRACRIEWLQRNIDPNIEDGDLMGGSQKYLLRGHTLIEDKVENAEKWSTINGRSSILIDQPWNRQEAGPDLIRTSWEDILSDKVPCL